ncbi:MAG: nucleotidyltransferase family protein [Candidatus Zhuqueibacterota bacterium]
MKAMILAAGYGTRLKPLTEEKPKALVEVNKIPMLELVIRKLIANGVHEIVINLHHFAEQISSFLEQKNNFGVTIHFSHEAEILGTGGGLWAASRFLKGDEPFILHNVDIMSTMDLRILLQHHRKNQALATLALMARDSSRYFLTDERNYICGHENTVKNLVRMRREPVGQTARMAFCGIHIIAPEIFDHMAGTGRFSIVDVYLDLAEKRLPIIGLPMDEFYWQDIGKIDALSEIESDIETHVISADELIR